MRYPQGGRTFATFRLVLKEFGTFLGFEINLKFEIIPTLEEFKTKWWGIDLRDDVVCVIIRTIDWKVLEVGFHFEGTYLELKQRYSRYFEEFWRGSRFFESQKGL